MASRVLKGGECGGFSRVVNGGGRILRFSPPRTWERFGLRVTACKPPMSKGGYVKRCRKDRTRATTDCACAEFTRGAKHSRCGNTLRISSASGAVGSAER